MAALEGIPSAGAATLAARAPAVTQECADWRQRRRRSCPRGRVLAIGAAVVAGETPCVLLISLGHQRGVLPAMSAKPRRSVSTPP